MLRRTKEWMRQKYLCASVLFLINHRVCQKNVGTSIHKIIICENIYIPIYFLFIH